MCVFKYVICVFIYVFMRLYMCVYVCMCVHSRCAQVSVYMCVNTHVQCEHSQVSDIPSGPKVSFCWQVVSIWEDVSAGNSVA